MDLQTIIFFLLALFAGYYAARWFTMTGTPH